jgi:hypothetical protein
MSLDDSKYRKSMNRKSRLSTAGAISEREFTAKRISAVSRHSLIIAISALSSILSVGYAKNVVLDGLDRASNGKEIQESDRQLEASDAVSPLEIKNYVDNHKNHPQKRYRAMRALYKRQYGPKAWQKIVERCDADSDREFRTACILDMGGQSGGEVNGYLVRQFQNANHDSCIQAMAGSSLAANGNPIAKSTALNVILTGQPCADFAIMTLANLHSNDVIPALRNAMGTSANESIKSNCRMAILRIESHGKSVSDQIAKAKMVFFEKDVTAAQRKVAALLAEIGTSQAMNALIDASNDRSAPGKEEAMMGLELGVQKGHWTASDVSNALVH